MTDRTTDEIRADLITAERQTEPGVIGEQAVLNAMRRLCLDVEPLLAEVVRLRSENEAIKRDRARLIARMADANRQIRDGAVREVITTDEVDRLRTVGDAIQRGRDWAKADAERLRAENEQLRAEVETWKRKLGQINNVADHSSRLAVEARAELAAARRVIEDAAKVCNEWINAPWSEPTLNLDQGRIDMANRVLTALGRCPTRLIGDPS